MCKRNTEQGKPYKRYRYKWDSKAFKAIICILSIVLLLLGAYGAWILSKTLRLSYDRTDAVSNAKQLISQIEYGSRTGEKLNIILKNDIELDQPDVDTLLNIPNREGGKGAWLYGKLDGQYNKIYFKQNVILKAPLFNCIAKDAVICNLTIDNSLLYAQRANGALATLSHTNMGALSNIRLDNCTVNLSGAGDKNLSVSGLVVYNFGKISCCAAKIDVVFLSDSLEDKKYFSQDGQKINVRWKSQFGAIATECVEGGIIENIVVQVKFPKNFAPMTLAPYSNVEEQERNLIVGYVVGYSKDYKSSSEDLNARKGILRNIFVMDSQNAQFACDRAFFEQGDSVFIGEKIKNWDGWESNTNIDGGFPQFVFNNGENK